MAAMEYRKTYVEVLCRIDVDGQVTPLSITWRDGRTFPIDRVEEAIRRASARVGGTGVRYRVSINGRDKYLFFEDPRWFVEEVVPTPRARDGAIRRRTGRSRRRGRP